MVSRLSMQPEYREMQEPLFPMADPGHAPLKGEGIDVVAARAAIPELVDLAATLPRRLRFGTSSWNYPGWAGVVWDRDYPEAMLSRHGLAAYASHPLMRTVSLDRGFYRPMTRLQFARYAAQVPGDFRFVVKAPAMVTDGSLRDESGRGRRENPDFLNPDAVLRHVIEPALEGLGGRMGVLVFQISPLTASLLERMPELVARLHGMLDAIKDACASDPGCIIAVEVRDPQWLTPRFTEVLRDGGATYCLGLHAKMPLIQEQLPILRALWPGPLVCRWNLHRRHGAFGYEKAKRDYRPYNRLVDPDVETRHALARVIAGTVAAGQNAYVTLGNKAEGSAPLSVAALAEEVRVLLNQ